MVWASTEVNVIETEDALVPGAAKGSDLAAVNVADQDLAIVLVDLDAIDTIVALLLFRLQINNLVFHFSVP